MGKYIVRRLLTVIPTLLGIVLIVFVIMSITPGSPAKALLGNNAQPEAIEALNRELGYYDPLPVRFWNYLVDILKGDLGISYRTRQDILPDLMARIPYTLLIGTLSMIFAALIGISIGILSAVKQYSVADTLSTSLAILASSVPAFWLAMLLMLLFTLRWKLLPSIGTDTWKHFVLPILTLSLATSSGLLRLTRTTMLETIRQDYIRTARAKGNPESIVIWKHALRNACIPIITNLGMRFGGVLGGTIVIESVFGIPGVGYYMLTSINYKDTPAVVSTTLFISAFFCVIMVLVDILYALVDPRIRERFAK